MRLLAVSKTKSAALVRACYDSGHRVFGENYVLALLLTLDMYSLYFAGSRIGGEGGAGTVGGRAALAPHSLISIGARSAAEGH